MKNLNNFYRSIVLMGLCLSAINSYGQDKMDAMKIIVIDAGHGETDSGAIGIDGIKEKDVVLNVALEIIRLNELLTESNLDILLTRYSDTLISLRDRTDLAKALQADVFISLHCNHSGNPNAKGIEVYVSKSSGNYLKESIFIGHRIEKYLVTNIGIKSRGVKFGNFQVLRETVDYIPSVLLEFGFLSNVDEAKYFTSTKNIEFIASLILEQLIKL